MLSFNVKSNSMDTKGVSYRELSWRQKYQQAIYIPYLGLQRGGEKDGNFSLIVATHPNTSEKIVVNYPGITGDIDGYARKYYELAEHVRQQNLAAVIRSGNPVPEDFGVEVNLSAMIEYAKTNAQEICGNAHPEVYLMGFSAGASAIAAVAHLYPEVSRILLLAPSGDAGEEAVKEGLRKFTGHVYIMIGKEDQVVGVGAGKFFYDLAIGASHRELIEIPNCDHQFRGKKNGMLVSQAPFYAFWQKEKPASLESLPSKVLYE